VRPRGVADGNQVNIPELVVGDECKKLSDVIGFGGQRMRSRKEPPHQPVPETDTGGQVEYTKALERTMLKELGKLPSELRDKRAPSLGNQGRGAHTRG